MWMERLNPNGYNEMWWDIMMIDMRWVSKFGNMGFSLRRFGTELKWKWKWKRALKIRLKVSFGFHD